MLSIHLVTKKEVVEALEDLESIEIPEGDNEGDAINHPSIREKLHPDDQERVDLAERLTKEYTRAGYDTPNNRGITELTKSGFPTKLNASQYDPCRLDGRVQLKHCHLDISDPSDHSQDD